MPFASRSHRRPMPQIGRPTRNRAKIKAARRAGRR